MEIFVSIFVVLLSISGGMCQAGATTGNNWSSTLNCFLITGSTVLCQACPPSHCGTDYYYPYLEIKEVASGVNSLAVTKCIKGSECTDTESFVEFKGTLDIYSQYWCAKQICDIPGRTYAIMDGKKAGCLPSNSTDPCHGGTAVNKTSGGITFTNCEVTEAQFWAAWKSELSTACNDFLYFGINCVDDCRGSNKYISRKWGKFSYIYDCSSTKINTEGEYYSYIMKRYNHIKEEFEIIKQTYPAERCSSTGGDSALIMYAQDSSGSIVAGQCIQESQLPDGNCPTTMKTKTGLESIPIKYCTFSSGDVEKYYGKSGENCEHKLFDEVGPCEHCPSNKPYLLYAYDSPFYKPDLGYPYDCLSEPSKDKEYICVRNMPTTFNGEYTTFHHVCYKIAQNPIGEAMIVKVGSGDTWKGNYLTYIQELCPAESKKSYPYTNTTLGNYTMCELADETLLSTVVYNSAGCIPNSNGTLPTCMDCTTGKMPYYTQYLDGTDLKVGAVICIDECPDNPYHHQAWTFNWGPVCYHMQCDTKYTYVLIGSSGAASKGGCVKSDCMKCPEGKLSGNTAAEYIKDINIFAQAAASDVCVLSEAEFAVYKQDFKKREKSSPEDSFASPMKLNKSIPVIGLLILAILAH